MKKFICETCGNEVLPKENGIFVCKGCGCQYLGEEVKQPTLDKIEGDASEKSNKSVVQNALENARGARARGDFESAAKHYESVIPSAPNHSEAIFYIAYARLEESLISNDTPIRRAALFSVLQGCLQSFANDFDLTHECEQRALAQSISDDLIKLSKIEFVFQIIHTNFASPDEELTNKSETEKLFPKLHLEMARILLSIAKKYETGDCQSDAVYLFKLSLLHARFVQQKFHAYSLRSMFDPVINEAHTGWHRADPTHSIPSESSSEGCYIATCVYGSYDCPAVWTLRRYRDDILRAHLYGRAFIRVYYLLSPTLVKLFGKTLWFQRFWRKRLDRIVNKLNENGIAGTSYSDKTR